jgi:hypothetical protein
MKAIEIDYALEGAFSDGPVTDDPFAHTQPNDAAMAAQVPSCSAYARSRATATHTLPKKGWTTSILSLHPSEYSQSRPDLSIPDTKLSLEWVQSDFRAWPQRSRVVSLTFPHAQVHGYRSDDCKGNVLYNFRGDMVWHAGKVSVHRRLRARVCEWCATGVCEQIGVVYNPLEHQQRFYQGHTKDITAMTLHPNGRHCATGESGATPKIMV